MVDRKPENSESPQEQGFPAIIEAGSEVAAAVRPLVEEAGVLKAGVVDELGARRRRLEALREQAIRELEEAREEAEAIRAAARKEGKREGLGQCEEMLAKARAEFEELRRSGEREMVELAFELARRILGRSLERHPEWVADMVAEVLPRARGHEAIEIRVHPDDLEWVKAQRDAYARRLQGVAIYFCGDDAVDRGGCVVETASGRIDACLETQLAVLKERLTGEER